MNTAGSDSSSQSWFRSANCDAGYGAALIGSVALLLALCATGGWGREHLQYQRDALAHYQWWRLISAHLVHLGWRHALLNCGGLAALWVLFAREYSARRWLWIALLSTAAIDAGLWFLHPAIDWYVGASGILHGIWAAGACAMYRRGEALGAGLLLLLIAKLAYEHQSGTSLFEGDLPLVSAAHQFGALGGLIGAVLPRTATKPL